MKRSSIAAALFLLGFSSVPLPASNVVVSNLSAGGTVLADSSGALLAAGSRVQLATFPGLDPDGIRGLAHQGPDALLAGSSPFGPAFQIGNGADQAAGLIEVTANQAVSTATGALYAVILNAPDAPSASELLVLKLADMVPADDLSSLPGYLAVHLRDAEVVFGGRSGTGFATQSAGLPESRFDTWIVAQLGEGSDPAARIAEADADGDGLANLLEYALGGSAGDPASRPRIELREQAGKFFVLSLRRTDDPTLEFICEAVADLSAMEWPLLDTPMTEASAPPFPAPDDHQWMQQELPSSSRAFVRIKVTADEAP